MAVLAPTRTGFSITLKARHAIGRAAGNDLRLTFREVSSEHAVIEWTGERWTIQDLGSSNGTLLNGKLVTPDKPVTLEVGDKLAFGHIELTYIFRDDSPPA